MVLLGDSRRWHGRRHDDVHGMVQISEALCASMDHVGAQTISECRRQQDQEGFNNLQEMITRRFSSNYPWHRVPFSLLWEIQGKSLEPERPGSRHYYILCHSKFVFAVFEQLKFKAKGCKKCRDEIRSSNGTPLGSCHDFGDKCKCSHCGEGAQRQ